MNDSTNINSNEDLNTSNNTSPINSKVKNTKQNKKNLTDEEIKEFLKNSILIPKDQWEKLPINSYISYTKEDNKFIKGGYIKLIFQKNNNTYLIYGTKIDKYNNDRYYKEFTINLSNIKDIYKKIDQSAIIEYQVIKNNIITLIDNTNKKLEDILIKMQKNENKIQQIEKKIIKIEENHYKTIKLIKNLHNIKSLDTIK
jgi:hypothetical protein